MRVSGVLAVFGILLALNFQRTSFLAVSLMSTAMAVVLFFGSGLGGLYLGTNSAHFNDQAKFMSHNLWCLALPWVSAVALGVRQRARLWWVTALIFFAAGSLLSLVWMQYEYRDTVRWGVPILLVVSLVLTVLMTLWAWLREITRQLDLTVGVLVYMVALLVPLGALQGSLSQFSANLWAAMLCILSAILLMRSLYLQHRMGRQVIARAKLSPIRDVLTGLLSREGMQGQLYKLRDRIRNEHTGAVFIYLDLPDHHDVTRLYGEEGLEMGLVQMAATLSTTLSSQDNIARISRNAFAITVMMPPDSALATRMAQKILSRLMVLSAHGTPMAGAMRLALSWLPLYGFRLDGLERRSIKALETLMQNKRIAWVGGAASHEEARQMLQDMRSGQEVARQLEDERIDAALQDKPMPAASTLYERIHRIEREMLHGVDTAFLVSEAERMSRLINEANSQSSMTLDRDNANSTLQTQDDFEATQLATRQPLQSS